MDGGVASGKLAQSRLHSSNPHGLHRKILSTDVIQELQNEISIMFNAQKLSVMIGGYFWRFSKTSFTTGRAENAFGQPA